MEAPFSESELNEKLALIVQRIVEGYAPERILLFGSYAYGQPDMDSDLDLLIVKQTSDRPIDRRVAVRMLLRDLTLRPAVSPLVVTRQEIEARLAMGDPFAEEIVALGRVLYERKRTHKRRSAQVSGRGG